MCSWDWCIPGGWFQPWRMGCTIVCLWNVQVLRFDALKLESVAWALTLDPWLWMFAKFAWYWFDWIWSTHTFLDRIIYIYILDMLLFALVCFWKARHVYESCLLTISTAEAAHTWLVNWSTLLGSIQKWCSWHANAIWFIASGATRCSRPENHDGHDRCRGTSAHPRIA